jgi:hypothetical protein
MVKEHRWLLLRADGSIDSQRIIPGFARPSETGDNPDGLRERMVSRHGDLTHEHFDVEKGRWVSDREKKRKAERRAHLHGLSRDELADLIATEVKAEITDLIAALAARVAELEKKAS